MRAQATLSVLLAGWLCGCTTIAVTPDSVVVKPGMRNVAVCKHGADVEVKVYPVSGNATGAATVLGLGLGCIFGPAGCVAGGALAALTELAGSALSRNTDSTPTCDAKPDPLEAAMAELRREEGPRTVLEPSTPKKGVLVPNVAPSLAAREGLWTPPWIDAQGYVPGRHQ